MKANVIEHLIEGCTLIIHAVRVGNELHLHTSLLEDNLLAAQPFAYTTECNDLHQFLTLSWNRTKTVLQTLTIGIEIFIFFYIIQLTIKQHTLRTTWHVIIREVHFKVTLYGTIINKVVTRNLLSVFHFLCIKVLELIVFQFHHSLIEDFLIGFIS